jgi:hypothetical protein
MSFGVQADIKGVFFDRPAVVAAVGRQGAAFLNRAGGYVRRVARNSMKKKGKARAQPKGQGAAFKRWEKEIATTPASPPGTPPFAHSESNVTTLRNIQYGFDRIHESVLVGPLQLNQKSTINGVTGAGTVPQLHEFGGSRQVLEKKVGNSWVPLGRQRPRPGQPVRRRMAKYPARPFMYPALRKSVPRFPSLFLRQGVAA